MMPPWLMLDYQRLVAALDHGRLGHALLFHGPAGWGQREIANALALAIIGQRSTGTACPDAANIAHPDLRWLAPEGPGGQIKIDDIRKLTQVILQTPRMAPRKVAVIDQAESINLQAANALLKTLEEPPAGSHLLLVTSALAELLPTIRSRCQLIAVRPVAASEALAWAFDGRLSQATDDARLEALAFELGHAPLRLRERLDAEAEPIGPALEAVLTGRASIGNVIEGWLRLEADLLLECWMRYVADGLKARTGRSQPRLSALAALPENALHAFWDELVRARALARSTSNPNLRLLLEALLLTWRDLDHASAA
jgi:DNA polymerase III subunit delta'